MHPFFPDLPHSPNLPPWSYTCWHCLGLRKSSRTASRHALVLARRTSSSSFLRRRCHVAHERLSARRRAISQSLSLSLSLKSKLMKLCVCPPDDQFGRPRLRPCVSLSVAGRAGGRSGLSLGGRCFRHVGRASRRGQTAARPNIALTLSLTLTLTTA
eukprot:scaffold9308_cov72-Phaeocystis_antarctica.AAC.2